MTTANKLTIMRIALIPVFLVVLYLDFAGAIIHPTITADRFPENSPGS